MTTIGLIGAGHIGSQVARLAVAHDYDVVISNSRGPETLSELVAELGPRARAATAAEAATAGDIVVVTVPLKNYRSVPVEPLRGKVVIDTNNYYPQRDGHIPELDNESTTTAELLQAHLPTSKVVKAFNHIYAVELTTHGQPPGTKNRRALVIAGDDREAKATVTRLLDQFGFDTVDAGPLKEGWRIQRDTPGYGPRRTSEELRKDLAAAKRYGTTLASADSHSPHQLQQLAGQLSAISAQKDLPDSYHASRALPKWAVFNPDSTLVATPLRMLQHAREILSSGLRRYCGMGAANHSRADSRHSRDTS